jgi:hypothetical protein
MSDAWVANLSSGVTVVERWIPGEVSPWVKLMGLCKENSLWVTNLRLTICSETVSLPSHAEGYWQIYQQTVLENVPAEKLPVIRGIGHVIEGTVKILWGVRTPMNTAYFYQDQRSIEGQMNIIWKPK